MEPAQKENAVKPGDVVDGRYRIIKSIGEGGMGTVFLAEHTLIKRRVAVKVLHQELAADANVVERFMNEARAAGTLGHANIVESTDMGFLSTGVPYIVFEYLEGSALTDEVYRTSGMPVRRAVKIATQIASALQAAHNAGIVHRDLKSENVFLTDRNDALDHVKVLDFGISKFLEGGDTKTRRGMIMGTPEFMAPEQISSPDDVDARVDIYALGVILYEMLAGRRPFQNDDPRTLLHRIMHSEPPAIEREDVPHGLLEVVFTLLQKDPKLRYQTMSEVEAGLVMFATASDAGGTRRSRMLGVQPTANTELDVPLPGASGVMTGMGAAAMATPWPSNSRLDTPWPAAAGLASLPAAPRGKASPVLYGMVGLGLIAGAAGLYLGLRGGSAPAPAAVAAAPPTVAPAAASAAAGVVDAKPGKISVVIDADAPGARVTMRRRVADAPMTSEISANDIVELVEVSAPGRKTVRYWLTFDRQTKLTAQLPKGVGVVEASEEETLIALGEATATPTVIATAPVTPEKAAADPLAKPVAKAVAMADAKPAPVDKPAAVLPAPRKIGRGDAPADAAGSASADATLATISPAKPLTPEVTPAISTITKPPVADKPVEPVADKPVAPAVVKPAVASISRDEVSAVANKNRAPVMGCFATGRKTDPKLAGSVTVSLTVNEAGKVVRQQIQSTLASPLVGACILQGLPKWSFAPRPGGGNVNTSYTFTLK